jgi:hypothetical protein
MATRSAIGMRTVDGRITAVYCHWDGYPSNNGAILSQHYTDPNKIVELITLGGISSLRPEIGEKHPFSKFEAKDGEYNEALYENMTTFYARDRGEELDVRVFNDAMEFVDHYESCGCEYFYLFNGKEWLVNAYGRKSSNGFPDFERVEEVLEREDA